MQLFLEELANKKEVGGLKIRSQETPKNKQEGGVLRMAFGVSCREAFWSWVAAGSFRKVFAYVCPPRCAIAPL